MSLPIERDIPGRMVVPFGSGATAIIFPARAASVEEAGLQDSRLVEQLPQTGYGLPLLRGEGG
ncbi:hypothetical protein EPO44_09060 [bacterium]|nr:MAG: hypothetical protein EPO44_09060 [bacterium]